MQQSDELLNRHQTAEILGVTLRHLHNIVRAGRLLPAKTGTSQGDMFRAEEVHALTRLRTQQLSLPDIAALAVQAQATARATQQRLDKLCHLLGIGVNRLSYEDDSVHALLLKVRDTRTSDLASMQTGAIMEWATTFHSIDESYLRVVENYTSEDSPWHSYLDLANELMRYAPLASETNTRFAFACLDSARKHLRHVAYFYVHTKLGADTAKIMFAETADDEIIGQLYPMQIGPD